LIYISTAFGRKKLSQHISYKYKQKQFYWDTLLFESTICLVSYEFRFVAQAAPNECVNRSRSVTTGRTLRVGLWNRGFIPDGCKNYLYGTHTASYSTVSGSFSQEIRTAKAWR